MTDVRCDKRSKLGAGRCGGELIPALVRGNYEWKCTRCKRKTWMQYRIAQALRREARGEV